MELLLHSRHQSTWPNIRRNHGRRIPCAWREQNAVPVAYVFVVYPTAVLIDAEDVFRAVEKLETDPSVSIGFRATEYVYPIQRAIIAE